MKGGDIMTQEPKKTIAVSCKAFELLDKISFLTGQKKYVLVSDFIENYYKELTKEREVV
jgi:hypothetical protein